MYKYKSNIVNYPDDWPCKNCWHLAKQHHFDQVAFKHTACLVKGNNAFMAGVGYEDNCGQFEGVDNLSYVEWLANERKSTSL